MIKPAKIVKYRCKKCGYSEEYSKKQSVMRIAAQLVLTTFLAFGAILMLYMLLVGPVTAISSLSTSVMMKYSGVEESDHELRDMGTNWTSNCAPYSQYCFMMKIYDNLDHVPYVQASLNSPIQSPLETYEKGGDCKNSALLFTSIMQASGAKSYVVCSPIKAHCISVVPDDDMKSYYIVDLTIPMIFELPRGSSVWDYHDGVVLTGW